MTDNLSQTFSALADPTRRAMLAQLSKGDANVSDLAKPFGDELRVLHAMKARAKFLQLLSEEGK